MSRLNIASDALEYNALFLYAKKSMRSYKIAQKVGKKIRITRRKKGLTQEELADKLKMHVSTLGRIERGQSNSPLQTLNKIAQSLGVSLKEIA